LSNSTDPTAGWSQVIGTSFVDGTVSLTVVPSIDVGDSIYFEAEIYFGSLTGTGGGAYLSMGTATAAFSGLGGVFGNYFDSGTGGMPYYLPPYMLLRTPELVIPATTAIINPCIILTGAAGATFTAQIGRCEVRKVGA
jgi:hypothetical protein